MRVMEVGVGRRQGMEEPTGAGSPAVAWPVVVSMGCVRPTAAARAKQPGECV